MLLYDAVIIAFAFSDLDTTIGLIAKVMKRELAYAVEGQSHLTEPLGRTRGSTSQFGCDKPVVPDPDANGLAAVDHSMAPQGRVRIYTRNKRFKSASEKSDGKTLILGDSRTEVGGGDQSAPKVEIKNEAEENLAMVPNLVPEEKVRGEAGTSMESTSGMIEVEVREESPEVNCNSGLKPKRFTRSALKTTFDDTETATGDPEGFKDAVIVEVEGDQNGSLSILGKLEMKMSKKIEIKGRPTTVRELFSTGLLEGYPVFYNGGKKGIPLRGTIKDDGILCSCSLCKGVRVVPPCQFEIHACRTYRRASQYICLENGKSLLDVVKECRKASVKELEETIQSFIGPLPVKESIICQNCKNLFLATSSAKMDQLCDSCMIFIKSKDSIMHMPYARSRASEPIVSLKSSEIAEVQTAPSTKRRGRKKRKFLEMTPKKNTSPKSLERKRNHWKMAELPKLTSVEKSTGTSSVSNSLTNQIPEHILKSLPNHTSPQKSSNGASNCVSPQSKNQWKITKKDQKMHRLVFEDGGLPDGTELAYYSRGQKLLSGYKRGVGIFCSCCSSEVSPSQFEAHAGWASRKKPYGYIYTSNGVSLHELAISLLKGRRYAAKDNDDLCIICADGGKLVLCDGCPRAFHKECASLSSIPRGKWYCKYCENMFQRERFVEHNANAVAAGRVPGVNAIEQVTNRCIRIVKSPEDAEVIACVICRAYDFSKSGFGPRTVILCDQCEKEYHVGCLKKRKMADLKELPKGKWFCCGECKRIYLALNNLLNSGPEKLPESSLDHIKKKLAIEGLDTEADTDVRWRILSGKVASRETRLLLSEAVAIFHDCFDPIVDTATGRDFIPSMVYGRNIRGQDFGGMFCAILTLNSQVVSAAILRIFGQDMAELPLVATRLGYQGKGYFQLLFSCIEKLLAFLNIRSFVLPAADEAESIWTKRFGFKKIAPDQVNNYKKICWQMINFKGTSMLEKIVPKCRIIRPDETDSDIPSQ